MIDFDEVRHIITLIEQHGFILVFQRRIQRRERKAFRALENPQKISGSSVLRGGKSRQSVSKKNRRAAGEFDVAITSSNPDAAHVPKREGGLMTVWGPSCGILGGGKIRQGSSPRMAWGRATRCKIWGCGSSRRFLLVDSGRSGHSMGVLGVLGNVEVRVDRLSFLPKTVFVFNFRRRMDDDLHCPLFNRWQFASRFCVVGSCNIE